MMSDSFAWDDILIKHRYFNGEGEKCLTGVEKMQYHFTYTSFPIQCQKKWLV